MNTRPIRHCKPNLLVLLTLFVSVGFLATSVVQASDATSITSKGTQVVQPSRTQQWLKPVWNFNLEQQLQNWIPEATVDKDDEALNLARPFGSRGPTLRLSHSLPDRVKRSLQAGGDHRIGAFGADNPDAFVFLEKRW